GAGGGRGRPRADVVDRRAHDRPHAPAAGADLDGAGAWRVDAAAARRHLAPLRVAEPARPARVGRGRAGAVRAVAARAGGDALDASAAAGARPELVAPYDAAARRPGRLRRAVVAPGQRGAGRALDADRHDGAGGAGPRRADAGGGRPAGAAVGP